MASSAMNASHKEFLGSLFSESVMKQKKKSFEALCKRLETYAQCPDTEIAVSEIGINPVEEFRQNLLEIRTIIFKRNESRLLHDGHFEEWNSKLFNQVLRVKNDIPKQELKAYIRQSLSRNIRKIKKNIEIIHKSDLKGKLVFRKEKRKKDGKRDEFLNTEIRKEWERLLKVMPIEDLVCYSLSVLKEHKELENQRETEQGVTEKNLTQNLREKGLPRIKVRK